MARKSPHLAGLGAVVVLALMAGGPRGWAESAAPASAAAKPTEKVRERAPEKSAEKVPEQAAVKTASSVQIRIPLPRARPQRLASAPTTGAPSQATAPAGPAAATLASIPEPAPTRTVVQAAASPAISSEDLATLKQAISLARNSKTGAATDLQKDIGDPLVRKLIEWVLLRSENNSADYSRYVAFIGANPSWPSISMFRRRAEAMLWQ